MEERLARFARETYQAPLDAETVHVMKRNIVDSVGGIFGSMYDTEMLANFDRLVDLSPGETSAPVWGTGRSAGITDAVFANTILGRRSDLLNTYFSPNGMGVSHPSDNVSLVLTLAAWLGLDGRQVLALSHLGYQLSCTFSTYYFPESVEFDHDAPALFYATLLIGVALGLTEDELVEAQRIAGGYGLDTNQSARNKMTDWKHCTYASCAQRGILAVKEARAGFAGPFQIYEGDAGVNRFFPHADKLFQPPTDLAAVVFKRWPALVFCQTPIDTALELAATLDRTKVIESVEVRTYEMAANIGGGAAAYQADSRAGRTHSMPYCVAVALQTGAVQYHDFDPPMAEDADLQALLQRTSIVSDDELSARFPGSSPCAITVTFTDGTTASHERDVPRGDPQDPLSDDELEDKLRSYWFFADSPDQVSDLLERMWALEDQPSVDFVLDPLNARRS